MAEPKTRPTDASVEAFINAVPDERKRADAFRVLALMREETGEQPVMWGESIVGFGSVPLKYASGRELVWPVVGFSPRKASLTLYVDMGFDQFEDLRARLGKHSVSKACLYVKRLSDVDEEVLRALVRQSVAHTLATTQPATTE